MNKIRRKKKRGLPPPLLRLAVAAGALIMIVLLSVALTGLMQPAQTPISAPTPKSETPTPKPTPSPEPTITPTPAVFAPFGAQYGFGGSELIPETSDTPQDAPTPSPAPTSAPGPETPTTLRKGAKGDDVRRMQEALAALGYLSDAADGVFGANTQSAVTTFQAVNQLSADGVAGNRTLTLLYSGNALDASHAPQMDFLKLVNWEHTVERGYTPMDLASIESVVPSSVLKVKYSGEKANRTATEALGAMLRAAIADGVGDWQVSSAYRSYDAQQKLVDQSVAKFLKKNPNWSRSRALSATYNTVAPAGTSEHQTGLAFDITVPGTTFKGTPQQKWLHKHCAEYGFVIRFTEAKQKITGFLAEDWHVRYVGAEAAQVMTKNNWCLEEYYEHMGL